MLSGCCKHIVKRKNTIELRNHRCSWVYKSILLETTSLDATRLLVDRYSQKLLEDSCEFSYLVKASSIEHI